MVERKPEELSVVGSIPTLGTIFYHYLLSQSTYRGSFVLIFLFIRYGTTRYSKSYFFMSNEASMRNICHEANSIGEIYYCMV